MDSTSTGNSLKLLPNVPDQFSPMAVPHRQVNDGHVLVSASRWLATLRAKASLASPQTAEVPGSRRIICANQSRTMGWSSTISTWVFVCVLLMLLLNFVLGWRVTRFFGNAQMTIVPRVGPRRTSSVMQIARARNSWSVIPCRRAGEVLAVDLLRHPGWSG